MSEHTPLMDARHLFPATPSTSSAPMIDDEESMESTSDNIDGRSMDELLRGLREQPGPSTSSDHQMRGQYYQSELFEQLMQLLEPGPASQYGPEEAARRVDIVVAWHSPLPEGHVPDYDVGEFLRGQYMLRKFLSETCTAGAA